MEQFLQYWPMAEVDPSAKVINNTLFTYGSCNTLEEAFAGIRVWIDGYKFPITRAWVQVVDAHTNTHIKDVPYTDLEAR